MAYIDDTLWGCKFCIIEQMANRTWRPGTRIVQLLQTVEGMNTYREGTYAIARFYDDRPKECTIEKPIDRDELRNPESKRGLITTVCTTVCFPTRFLQIVE